MTDFRASIRGYESWMRARLGDAFVAGDLKEKHKVMRKELFSFLRGTCWRWAETAPAICPELIDAPPVASVVDAHVGNFGLWRDADARLVWGINDYDEACVTPWPLDLVRLTASALIAGGAAAAARARPPRRYSTAIAKAWLVPAPRVLELDRLWLRDLFSVSDKKREEFWERAVCREAPQEAAARAFRRRALGRAAGAGPRARDRAPPGGGRQPRPAAAGRQPRRLSRRPARARSQSGASHLLGSECGARRALFACLRALPVARSVAAAARGGRRPPARREQPQARPRRPWPCRAPARARRRWRPISPASMPPIQGGSPPFARISPAAAPAWLRDAAAGRRRGDARATGRSIDRNERSGTPRSSASPLALVQAAARPRCRRRRPRSSPPPRACASRCWSRARAGGRGRATRCR